MRASLRVRLASAGLVGVVIVFAAVPSRAQTTGSPDRAARASELPTLGEIMDQALARAKAQDEAGAELRFESRVLTTIDSLDGDETITETETRTYRRYPLEGAIFEELVARDGRPLDEDERKEQRARVEEFRREAIQARERGQELETNDERQVRFDEDLMARYRAAVTGERRVDDEMCWVIEFEPRDGELPEDTRLDKALNRSAGTLYVAQSDHGIRRIEFRLLRPVRYLWGLVASLRTATGRLDFVRVEPDVWLPRQFDLRIDLRVLFRTTRQRVVREWVERDPVTGRLDAIAAR